jgi:hypothetical protein
MEKRIIQALESRLINLHSNKPRNKQEIKNLEYNIRRVKTHIAKIEHLNQEIYRNFEILKSLRDQTRLYKVFLRK